MIPGGHHPIQVSCKDMNINRVLICGKGSIGRRHHTIINKHWPSIEVAYARSGASQILDKESTNQIQFYDFDQAINWEPDAAIISNPAPFHLETSLKLVQSHIPLLLEKPVGNGDESDADWQQLLQYSSNLPILVAYILRYDPCAQFVKSKINSGYVGELVEADFFCGSWLPNWRTGISYQNSVSSIRSLGGGVLLENSHEIDLANWLLGPFELHYSMTNCSGKLEVDVEDRAYLAGYGRSEIMISIRLNFCTSPTRRDVLIRGTCGEIYWDLVHGKVHLNSDNGTKEVHSYGISSDERYFRQMKHFLSCVNDQHEPFCSLHEGLSVLRIIQQARHFDDMHRAR